MDNKAKRMKPVNNPLTFHDSAAEILFNKMKLKAFEYFSYLRSKLPV